MPARKNARKKDAAAKFAKQTLRLPAPQGVRLVALGFLEDAGDARKRLAQAHDAKALHDFRVALRRLRSWLRSFKVELDGSVKRKHRRSLRDIASATNLGRDIDVQLHWLHDARKGLSRKRRRGADWMKQYLTTRQRQAGDPVDTELLKKFSKTHKDLTERLSTVEQPVKNADIRTLASAIALRITTHVEALDDALAEVHDVADEKQAHEARIAAKRLRYLLEPAAPQVKGGGDVLEMLKSLQDELGDLHDSHVLGHELTAVMASSAAAGAGRLAKRVVRLASPHDGDGDGDGDGDSDGDSDGNGDGDGDSNEDRVPDAPQNALATLGRRVGQDAQKAFDRVHEGWLGGRYARFKRDIATFAERLDEKYS